MQNYWFEIIMQYFLKLLFTKFDIYLKFKINCA